MAHRVLNMARRAVVMGHSIGMAVVDVRLGRGDGEAGEVHSALSVFLPVALGLDVPVSSLHGAPTISTMDP